MNQNQENIITDKLIAYLNRELPVDEAVIIENWIVACDTNRIEYEKIKKVWDATKNPLPRPATVNVDFAWRTLSEKILQLENETSEKQIQKTVININFYLKVAAVIIPLTIGLAFLWNYINKPEIQQFTSGSNKSSQFLADGSRVQLNINTTIEYPAKFSENQRNVSLNGHAFFSVKKNLFAPFIVTTDGLCIKVTGTEFDVKALSNSDSIEVYVKTGQVILYSGSKDGPSDSLKLKNEEKGIYVKSINKLFREFETGENELFWLTGNLIFRKTSLMEVFNAIESAYHVKILVHNVDLYNLQLTTSFYSMPVEQVMNVIDESFSFRIISTKKGFEVYAERE